MNNPVAPHGSLKEGGHVSAEEVPVDRAEHSAYSLFSMTNTVKVELDERSYDIRIGAGLLPQLGALCSDLGLKGRCLVVTDSNVDVAQGNACMSALQAAGFDAAKYVLPAGESSKDLAQLARIYTHALAHGMDRGALMVALGGGVVGDLAGFAAATYLRGIALVQVPTSVVAMVDSAVGGKTGINLPEGKNLVGSFYQPALVLADRDTLGTLPEREYISGLAEVVKYGMIRDRALFEMLEERAAGVLAKEVALLDRIIARSCEIKADVVRQDEREGGLRAILNFGHTLGHALEKVSGYGRYLHGEAIAVGMVYAAHLSARQTGFPAASAARLSRLLEKLGLPVAAPGVDWKTLRKTMDVDKKTVGLKPKFVLAKEIGDVVFGAEVAEDTLQEAWKQMR